MSSSRNSPSPAWPRAASATVDGERLRVALRDGREIAVPLESLQWLASATEDQRKNFSILDRGAGIWWNELDEGLSVPGLFGLPENPPRPRRDSYLIRYRHDGRQWIAELTDFESDIPARTLAAAKRGARELLGMLLGIEDVEAAGIEVIDEVQPREAVAAT